jgi:hypothetical protein
MTREELAAEIRHAANTWMSDGYDERPLQQVVIECVLAALEGHAVIDGQPRKLEREYLTDEGWLPLGGQEDVWAASFPHEKRHALSVSAVRPPTPEETT